jgi:cyclic beta-1,2-glucan synthetase
MATNRSSASGLWPYGISGDLPIALVRIERDEERDVVRQLLRAQEYWRLKGIAADLVILNTTGASYAQALQESLEGMVRASQAAGEEQRREHGGVYLLRADLVSPRDQILLRAAARLVILAHRGIPLSDDGSEHRVQVVLG